jgi:hypothetical protein
MKATRQIARLPPLDGLPHCPEISEGGHIRSRCVYIVGLSLPPELQWLADVEHSHGQHNDGWRRSGERRLYCSVDPIAPIILRPAEVLGI